jgi:hypothetical protein
MKRIALSFIALITLVFPYSIFPWHSAASLNHLYSTPGAPPLQWHTFLSMKSDFSHPGANTVDADGNFFQAGQSTVTWGIPVSAFNGHTYVVKVSNVGTVVWNTFIGSASTDMGVRSMAVDRDGNVYLAGYCVSSWGSPINPIVANDVMVVKLNNNGELIWNTFMGSSDLDDAGGIDVDTVGNVYVSGNSYSTWGTPLRPFAGDPGIKNSFVAKLNSQGTLLWNTFLGGSNSDDVSVALSVTSNGTIYNGGRSKGTWGSPISPFIGVGNRGFVVQLDNNGVFQWNTFLGQSDFDSVYSLSPGSDTDILAAGLSDFTWGNPLVAYGNGGDGFVARFDNTGHVLWNTFIGCLQYDYINMIKRDSAGNIYAVGSSNGSWGTPTNPYVSGYDGFILKLNGDGSRVWNTFLGSTDRDTITNIGADNLMNLFVIGWSATSWGTPLNPWTDQYDSWFAKLGYNFDHQIYLPVIIR